MGDCTVIVRKEAALKLLRPLGFTDWEDDENPGWIHHEATGCVDISYLHPQELVKEIFRAGEESGKAYVRTNIMKALGLQ